MTPMTEDDLTRAVLQRLEGASDPRFKQVMASLITHLHAFVREVDLTPEEWIQTIFFLTDVGKACDDKRQEFILLSDTLGVSMLVETINDSPYDDTTQGTVLGPFFIDNMPLAEQGGDISAGRTEGATPLDVAITVVDRQGQPIAGAQVDIWQSAADGLYDVQRGLPDGHFELRARFLADDKGQVRCRSVMPIPYQVPTDGPVGDLLAATKRHPWRPAHVHFRISAEGHPPLTTHLFPTGDPYLASDAVFGVKPALVIDIPGSTDGRSLTYTFVLE